MDAQVNLGICYEEGSGVIQDLETAIQLYTAAANRGNAHALNNLGFIRLTQNNLETAKRLFTEAAHLGRYFGLSLIHFIFSIDALYNLGLYYERLQTTASFHTAFEYYVEASEKGHAKASKRAGDFLYSGIGTAVNKTRSANYYLLAAQQVFIEIFLLIPS